MTQDDFYTTANRCWQSFKILHEQKEYHNACYLGGYVVECYLKLIIRMGNAGEPAKIHALDTLWTEVKKHWEYIHNNSSKSGRLSSDYMPRTSHPFPNLLGGHKPWKVEMRYASLAEEWTEQDAKNFKAELRQAMVYLAKIKTTRN